MIMIWSDSWYNLSCSLKQLSLAKVTTRYVYKITFFIWQYLPKKKSPIEGFTLHYKEYSAQTNFTKLQLLEPNIRTYMIQDLKPAVEYTLRIQSFNTAGNSQLSNEVVMRTKGGKSVTSKL
jgi:hypothetical protein